MKLKQGINKNIPNQAYHDERKHVSSSGLKLMLKNPRVFHKVYVLNEESEQTNKAALDFGSYLHCRILEPHLEEEEFAIYEGGMKRGKKWEEFQEKVEGDKIVITASQKRQADYLLSNFKETTVLYGSPGNEKKVPVSSFFDKGEAELTICHELNGVKVKVRMDYHKDFEDFGSINDVKTTSGYIDTKEQVEKICAQFDYDLSAALYVDVASEVMGKPQDFYFCFISKKDGACRIYRASAQMLQRGREKYTKAINALRKARETGVYYENKIEELDSIEL